MLNNEMSAGTKADQGTNADDMHVSPAIGNTVVGSSPSLSNRREIKFRGLTLNSGWVYGLLSKNGNDYYISNRADKPFAFHVRPETVSQLISLYKTKEFYEGDIIEAGHNKGLIKDLWTFRWLEIECEGKIVKGSKLLDQYHQLSEMENIEKANVIGNVYENPELLEGIK